MILGTKLLILWITIILILLCISTYRYKKIFNVSLKYFLNNDIICSLLYGVIILPIIFGVIILLIIFLLNQESQQVMIQDILKILNQM